jgi:threonine aldolase
MAATVRTVDLRSDSVTKATPEMRQAMAEAVVGDEGREGDPTCRRLEQRAAELMGQEAGLFCTSGTMANLVALMAHTRPGEEVIAERTAHILHFETGGIAAIAGAVARCLPGVAGRMDLAEVEATIRAGSRHSPRTALIEVENTHNLAGGTVLDVAYMQALWEVARRHQVPVHLDGERIFNAAVALGVPAKELTAGCDSVMFGLSKGLCAPYGSVLCGSTDFVERARFLRQRVGGGVRQIGHMAAPGLVALETMVDRLAEDHANARQLAEGITRLRPDLIDLELVQTNIVMLRTAPLRAPAAQVALRFQEAGVLCAATSAQAVRFVTHHDVNEDDIAYALSLAPGVLAAFA